MGGARLGHGLQHLLPQSREHPSGPRCWAASSISSLARSGRRGVLPYQYDQIRQLLEQSGTRGSADMAVRMALGHSLHLTFWAVFLITVVIPSAGPPCTPRRARAGAEGSSFVE